MIATNMFKISVVSGVVPQMQLSVLPVAKCLERRRNKAVIILYTHTGFSILMYCNAIGGAVP